MQTFMFCFPLFIKPERFVDGDRNSAGDAFPSLPNGLELSCPAEAGYLPSILAHAGGQGARPYGPARRVSFPGLRPGQAATC